MMRTERWADDMAVEELGGGNGMVLIRRGEKLVGYYYEEYQWEHKEVDHLDPTELTRVTYGSPGPGDFDRTMVEITKKDEIALWLAAYQNHTEYQTRHASFVPLTPEAGFAFSREELDYGGSHLCHLGVRFYSSDKLVLEVSGHLHESPTINMRTRNVPLHLLVKARMPEVKKSKKEKPQPELSEDPFSDPVPQAEPCRSASPAPVPESGSE